VAGKKVIDMTLPADDAADYLNFVLKDASTNTWYDSNGSNFQLALRTSLRSFMSMDDAEFVRPRSLDLHACAAVLQASGASGNCATVCSVRGPALSLPLHACRALR
jgi:hypothetical protein